MSLSQPRADAMERFKGCSARHFGDSPRFRVTAAPTEKKESSPRGEGWAGGVEFYCAVAEPRPRSHSERWSGGCPRLLARRPLKRDS
eukprot:7386608-Prymnesium_polylepis.1